MPDGATTMSLGELMSQGGTTMVPIYLCSIAGLAVFIRKFLEFRRARLKDLKWLEPVLKLVGSGSYDDIPQAYNGSPHPGTRVVQATVKALQEKPEHAEAEARRVASLEIQKLEKNLNVLSFLAQVAPLLGLLGTVLGMVDLFIQLQSAGQGNVAVAELSSGIWKALLTTAAGLTVAVPALAAHSYLASQIDRLRLQVSNLIQRVLYVASKPQV
ncbi:MAG: hypothetical protein CMH56_06145 [Myxococcales bacterium]|nr:hypothetical protein [Myxococcales bacterium]|tara:strand:- start:605 stop:1246 length:642 start_codon:yes stop_codon:yes gene_type:complete